MIKDTPYKPRLNSFFLHCTASVLLMSVLISGADASIREEALAAVTGLNQYQLAYPLSQELKSIENSFAHAEEFSKKSQPEIADRYYLLTIQKVRVFISSVFITGTDSKKFNSLKKNDHDAGAGVGKKLNDPGIDPLPNPDLSIPAISSTGITTSKLPVSTDDENKVSQDLQVPEKFEELAPFSDKLVGKKDTYVVVRKDTLRLVAAKLGVSRGHLSEINGIGLNSPLKVGQTLKYNNRKIIPQRMKEGIVINIPDRTLYFFKGGKLARSLPVALGKPLKNSKHDWTTPVGKFQIVAKQKDPTWKVPASIRSEMEETGKDILETVPPGPANPLGKYAIRTSLHNILIHSTSQPASIYSFASHGCIRVYPEHMEDFFYQIRVKTIGEIIYRPVKLAVTENNRIYLEVHHDAYGKSSSLDSDARGQITKMRLKERVDWSKVEAVIRQKTGIAEDVTLDLLDSPTNRAESEKGLSGA